MTLSMRRALVVAALFIIAGCGAAGQNSLAPSGTTSSAANRLLVPAGAFFPSATHHAAARRSIYTTYSTMEVADVRIGLYELHGQHFRHQAALGGKPDAGLSTID